MRATLVHSGKLDDDAEIDVPALPLAQRTLESSNFRASYITATPPGDPMTLGLLLGDLIRGHCLKHSIPWDTEGKPYLDRLNQQVMANSQELTSASSVPGAVQRMWTSALQLGGREFCSILNAAVRDDDASLSEPAARLTRAINMMCVTTAGGARAVHPPDNLCVRGGGFDEQYRTFFVQGKQFRQPAFLPTSFSLSTADSFIARVPDEYPKVRWLVRIDPERKCVHVNLVTKRVPGLPDEQEYLFAPCETHARHFCHHKRSTCRHFTHTLCHCNGRCQQILHLQSQRLHGRQERLLNHMRLSCWRLWITRKRLRTCRLHRGRDLSALTQ